MTSPAKKVLILFAHPSQHRSEVNVALIKQAQKIEHVTVVDLYHDYPKFNIDIDKEQKQLLDHDVMVFPTGGPFPRHPSQLYEFALEGVVLFLILNWFIRKPRPLGTVSGLFLFGYGTFRFLVEYVRQPDAQLGLFGDWISMGQILSLPMVIGGLLMMLWAFKRNLYPSIEQPQSTTKKK